MSRGVLRRWVASAGAAGLLTTGGIALASGQSGSSDRVFRRPHLSERRILQLAERAAARAGDRYPILIQHSQGTRHNANLVDSGDVVPGGQWSYLIAERGHFVLNDAPRPSGASAPRGSVLTLIVNAAAGGVSDSGVSNRYPDLDNLGPVHTDLRRQPNHHRSGHRDRAAADHTYGVDIQADYDRNGNPLLVANFSPDGDLAKPHWAICSPPHRSVCRPVKVSRLLEPGPTAARTAFRASARFRGHTYKAYSAIWTGQVHATRSPSLEGQAQAGARVRPRRATWQGGWKAVPGYMASPGMDSGGRAPSLESLSIEACRTSSGVHCVNLTPQGKSLDFAQEPVIVPRQFIGWYLFAFDEHLSPDTAFALPAYATFAIPPLKVGATVARSAPIGPVTR